MAKIRYALVGFGGIAENRVAKEGFACDRGRFKPLRHAQLVARAARGRHRPQPGA